MNLILNSRDAKPRGNRLGGIPQSGPLSLWHWRWAEKEIIVRLKNKKARMTMRMRTSFIHLIKDSGKLHPEFCHTRFRACAFRMTG
jgi:hypothetical protein